MTSDDCCYYGALGTRVVSISGPLLLPSKVATCYFASDAHCYYWAWATRVVATSDDCSDISEPSLLTPTGAMG
jgi:hypothetical protein